jgi:hypothetical protein
MKLVKFKDGKIDSYFLRVSESEALSLISSMSQQMVNKNPNAGRLESYTINGEYFTISVHPDGTEIPLDD